MITEHIDRSKFMINKLVEKIRKTGAPIVVGLDPMMKFVLLLQRKARHWKVQQRLSGFIIKKSLIRHMI